MRNASIVLAAALLIVGCSEAPNQALVNADDSSNATEASIESPNYTEEEDGVYSYVAAVSEEDQKQGKAAGNVIRFAFRGIKDGKYVISLVDDDGETLSDSECSKPCRIIKTRLGDNVVRQEFTPESMIGAAFEDALNGHLKVAPGSDGDTPVSDASET